jgi:hypothetical protein
MSRRRDARRRRRAHHRERNVHARLKRKPHAGPIASDAAARPHPRPRDTQGWARGAWYAVRSWRVRSNACVLSSFAHVAKPDRKYMALHLLTR